MLSTGGIIKKSYVGLTALESGKSKSVTPATVKCLPVASKEGRGQHATRTLQEDRASVLGLTCVFPHIRPPIPS